MGWFSEEKEEEMGDTLARKIKERRLKKEAIKKLRKKNTYAWFDEEKAKEVEKSMKNN